MEMSIPESERAYAITEGSLISSRRLNTDSAKLV